MIVTDSTPNNRRLTLSCSESLDSATVVAFLRSEGHSAEKAAEIASQTFDLLESVAYAQRHAADAWHSL